MSLLTQQRNVSLRLIRLHLIGRLGLSCREEKRQYRLYLQDWHKEDYREVMHRYHGVATDSLPHSIFIAKWIMGSIAHEGSTTADVGGLDLNVEDTAGVLLSGPEGQPVVLTANYLQRDRGFSIRALTKKGKEKVWNFDPAHVSAMYYRQMDMFCSLCARKKIGRYPNLVDGQIVQGVLDVITA